MQREVSIVPKSGYCEAGAKFEIVCASGLWPVQLF
jgi:hypothetical protein